MKFASGFRIALIILVLFLIGLGIGLSHTSNEVYILYLNSVETDNGAQFDMMMTFNTYNEAIEFCNSEPLSDECNIFKSELIDVPAIRGIRGNIIGWGNRQIQREAKRHEINDF